MGIYSTLTLGFFTALLVSLVSSTWSFLELNCLSILLVLFFPSCPSHLSWVFNDNNNTCPSRSFPDSALSEDD